MTPPTTAPGPQPQPPRQASALLEVAIAAAPILAAATRAVKSFRIVSTSIHDRFCRPTQDEGTLHIDWLIPTERLLPRMWISSGNGGKRRLLYLKFHGRCRRWDCRCGCGRASRATK